ncbi:MAG TPA: DUF4389 domain-containing protein, partial [Spirochaetia bacterium]|nr:DUF4389 domain-containing protein [Spirochaetia bacterium]
MQYTISRQDAYSRGLLILRLLFGSIYIGIPHYFMLFFASIWAAILQFLAFWAVLFTGKYPRGWFDFQVAVIRWGTRVSAAMANLRDEYPAFGRNGTHPAIQVDVEYPEKLSRGLLILRVLFGVIYVGIPHGFCLFFRGIGTAVLMFISWWAQLFTGKYPEKMFDFNVGTYRWAFRVSAY